LECLSLSWRSWGALLMYIRSAKLARRRSPLSEMKEEFSLLLMSFISLSPSNCSYPLAAFASISFYPLYSSQIATILDTITEIGFNVVKMACQSKILQSSVNPNPKLANWKMNHMNTYTRCTMMRRSILLVICS